MNDFNQNRNRNRFGNGNNGNRRFGSSDRPRAEMHSAICDQCGKDCQVPFRPSSGKPIFCSSCFEQRGGGGERNNPRYDSRPTEHRNFSKNRDRNSQEMHPAVCDQCGKSCQVPFHPNPDKPIYCTDCFSSKKNNGDKRPRKDSGYENKSNDIQSLKNQMSTLNSKIDLILKAMSIKMEKSNEETHSSTKVKKEIKETQENSAKKEVEQEKISAKQTLKEEKPPKKKATPKKKKD